MTSLGFRVDAADPTVRPLRICEIFGPTIQGEGVLIGQPTIFVRTGGCDYRCSWCDSLHAVDPAFRGDWLPMAPAAVFAEIERLSGGVPVMVSLSGGNPALQPFEPLLVTGQEAGYRFALETQGSVAQPWFSGLDVLTLSPKPPSSGMRVDWDALAACRLAAGEGPRVVLKVVVFDEADYAFARIAAMHLPGVPVYLQPGNPSPPRGEDDRVPVDPEHLAGRLRWLAERVTRDRWYEATVLPQLHVILWGNKRGV